MTLHISFLFSIIASPLLCPPVSCFLFSSTYHDLHRSHHTPTPFPSYFSRGFFHFDWFDLFSSVVFRPGLCPHLTVQLRRRLLFEIKLCSHFHYPSLTIRLNSSAYITTTVLNGNTASHNGNKQSKIKSATFQRSRKNCHHPRRFD